MINEEILLKAIDKAVKNGYKTKYGKFNGTTISFFTKDLQVSFIYKESPYQVMGINYESIIFSHNFAKAFWGEEYEDYQIDDDGYVLPEINQPRYLNQLMNLVLEEDPVKYLEKFL